MKPNDCVVIGGGIVGLATAIGMRQRGYTVVVVDHAAWNAHTDYPDARVYAINAASERLLKHLNVWDKMDKDRMMPYQHMHVWDSATHSEIDFDARDCNLPHLGYMIESCVIKQALYQTAQDEGVELQFSTPAEAYAKDTTQLWLITDGAQSKMRETLGVSLTTWPYHQSAIVTTLQIEKNHQKTAWQVFTGDGPLAFLPLSNPNHVSIVYSTSTKHTEQLMNLDESDFAQYIAKVFEMKLGSCKVISKRFSFPLIMRQAQEYCGSHWLLLGDSAHTIHPLAGLGLNVGLADVSTWLTLLSADKRPLLSQVRLKKYQRQRKSAVWEMILAIEGLKWSFSNTFPPLVFLRQKGLQLCQQSHFMKQFFLDKAQGDLGT